MLSLFCHFSVFLETKCGVLYRVASETANYNVPCNWDPVFDSSSTFTQRITQRTYFKSRLKRCFGEILQKNFKFACSQQLCEHLPLFIKSFIYHIIYLRESRRRKSKSCRRMRRSTADFENTDIQSDILSRCTFWFPGNISMDQFWSALFWLFLQSFWRSKKCFCWLILMAKLFYREHWSNLDHYSLIGGGICLLFGSAFQFSFLTSKPCFSLKSVALNSFYTKANPQWIIQLLVLSLPIDVTSWSKVNDAESDWPSSAPYISSMSC